MGAGAVTRSLGTASGSIIINTASLDQAVAKSRAAGKNIETNLGRIDAGAKKAQGGFASIAKSLGSIAVAYGGLSAAQSAFDLGSLAATNERTRDSFDKLATGIGSSGDRMLASLQKTSRGAIADADLVLNANRAILLGAAKTSAEVNQLLEVAAVRGKAVGRDVTESFGRIVQGIGKLEPEGLDELGLAINLVQVFDQYAKSLGRTAQSLTQAEKRTALFNKVVGDSAQMVADAAKEGDDAAASFEKYAAATSNAKDAVGKLLLNFGLTDTIDNFTASIKGSADEMKRLTDWTLKLQSDLSGFGEATGINAYLEKVNANIKVFQDGIAEIGVAIGTRGPIFSGPTNSGAGSGSQGRGRGAGGVGVALTAPGFSPEILAQQRSAKIEFENAIQSIERSAHAARLSATMQYEQQRSEAIRSYGLGVAREAEDFARSRARAQVQFDKQVADIHEEAGKREADAAGDLQESIGNLQAEAGQRMADAQDDTNKRIAELNEDYQRNRERAERDHKGRLIDAASRLDAVAVYQEQKKFATEAEDAKNAHEEALSDAQEGLQERLSQERDNLAERVAQEQEAHAERLQAAREADAERIAEMVEAQAEAQALEDEDRAIAASRAAEDHAAQLASMDAAHAAQMAAIDQQEADELKSAQEAHLKELEELGVFNAAWKAIQDAKEAAALKSWALFWEEFNKALKVMGPQTEAQAKANQWKGLNLSDPTTYPGYAQGGFVGRTGLAMVHAGERVLTRQQQGRGGATLNMAAGAIVVNAAAGMNEALVAELVRQRLVAEFRELAN